MSRHPQFPNPYGMPQPLDYVQPGTRVVATFMNAVYAWMCVGLALTAGTAFFVSTQKEVLRTILSPGMLIFLILAQLGLVMVISWATQRVSAALATALFLLYAVLNGLTLSVIFLVYSLPAITAAFIVTAGMFGVMSIIGFVTKKDLTGLGSFLLMGLIGLVLASIVNIFFQSTMLGWIITYAGVFIFLGLTAYDTQKLKEIAYATEGDPQLAARLSISGALVLYLDFINLFLMILRILGSKRG